MAIVSFKEFTGMLQTRTSRFLRPPNELTRAINVVSDTTGAIQKRLGYSIIGSTLTNSISGLHSYYRLNGDAYLIAMESTNLQVSTGGAFTNQSAVFANGSNYELATFIDEVFICGYNPTARTFDTIRNLDNLTVTTTNNLNAASNAKIPIVFRQRLYLISLTGRRSAFQYSAVPTNSGTVITWPTANFEEVRTDDGDELMGAANLSNRLVLFKNNSMHEWNESTITQVAEIGTPSHRSIVNTGSYAFFFSRSKNLKGFYVYAGGQPKLISNKIQEWCDGIADGSLDDIVGWRQGENIIWFVGTITIGAETFTNSALVYNMANNVWAHFQYQDTVTAYAPFIISGTERPYVGTSDGEVHQMAITGDTVYSDNTVAIPALFRTNKLDFGASEDKKRISKTKFFAQNAQGLQVRVRGDDGNWQSLGQLTKTVSEFAGATGSAHYFEFEGSESSANPPFIFEGFSVATSLDSKFD